MKHFNIPTCVAVILGLASVVPGVMFADTLPVATETQTREASTAKVTQLLQQSGYTYRKTGQNTWGIERPAGKKGWILLATGPNFLVLGIIVAVKKNMRPSTDLNFTLLKLNHSLDFAKVGFDDDDDLFVRTEERIRIVDLQEFKALVETVDSAADTAYEKVKPFLLTP